MMKGMRTDWRGTGVLCIFGVSMRAYPLAYFLAQRVRGTAK